MKLLIVLQSYSVTDSQKLLGFVDKDTIRYPEVPKIEVSKTCINSLIGSINYLVKHRPDIEPYLQIYDDHSSKEFIEYLEELLTKCNFDYNLETLEETGILKSFDACYNYGKLFGEDLVYFSQDDYLYEESCLVEMIEIYEKWKPTPIGRGVCVYPFNDPYRYEDHNIVPVRIVQGKHRHWRTSYQTASCFMMDHETLVNEWDLFEDFYNHPVDPEMEDDTINKLFQERQYVLFTPIPSLALHVQFEREKDPYIDWTILWNKYKPKSNIELPEKVVLNVGSGSRRLNYKSLSEYTEITFDLDSSLNPDIVGNILELDVIPSKSIDVFWASHILEHIHVTDSLDVYRNINRILKDSGLAIIIVPNIKEIADYVKSGNLHEVVYQSECGPITAQHILYGLNNSFMGHKTGYTKEFVSELLISLKINAFVQEAEQNLFIIITKGSLENTCVSIDNILDNFYGK